MSSPPVLNNIIKMGVGPVLEAIDATEKSNVVAFTDSIDTQDYANLDINTIEKSVDAHLKNAKKEIMDDIKRIIDSQKDSS